MIIPAVLALGLGAAAAGAPPAVHAVVVGVNASVDPGVEPLEFADDDAARYAELLAPGADVHLLALLDPATQRRFPQEATRARAPTHGELERALQETFQAIEADQRAGREADLIFVFIGHGGVDPAGEGYVSLQDGRLTRTALFAAVVNRSPARFNHIVVDACDAFALLNRGDAAVDAVRALLNRATLSGHPNTGALLATSADRPTHEWSRIEGGVFSHEVLSALAGAADADGDGRLGYDEVGAFVEAANEGVLDRRAHLDVFVRPPALMVNRALWTLPTSTPRLELGKAVEGRISVVDARGVIVAETFKSAEAPVSLALPGAPPFTVEGALGDRTTAGAAGPWQLEALPLAQDAVRPRATEAQALEQGLFTQPFGPSYVRGYRVQLLRDLASPRGPDVKVAPPADDDALLWTGAGVGVAALATVVVGGALLAVWLSQPRGSLGTIDWRTGW